MTIGGILSLITIPIIIGLGIWNIRSLVRKWKFNKRNWFDLLVGIVIWTVAIGGLIWIFIKQLPQ